MDLTQELANQEDRHDRQMTKLEDELKALRDELTFLRYTLLADLARDVQFHRHD